MRWWIRFQSGELRLVSLGKHCNAQDLAAMLDDEEHDLSDPDCRYGRCAHGRALYHRNWIVPSSNSWEGTDCYIP